MWRAGEGPSHAHVPPTPALYPALGNNRSLTKYLTLQIRPCEGSTKSSSRCRGWTARGLVQDVHTRDVDFTGTELPTVKDLLGYEHEES